MSTMTEVFESRTSRLKNALYDWKEVVLPVNSVLTWEQEWFPGVTAGVVTLFYLIVWYWDPTDVFTNLLILLFLSMADYIGPKIISQVFGTDSWTSFKDKQYEQVCEDILSAKDKIEAAWTLCREARSKKPVFHFIATVVSLFCLAWLGNTINNFFLAYLLNVAVLMIPGLNKKGILKQYGAQLTLKIAEVMKGKDFMKKVE
jgi:Flp pilus assembly protein TadB